MSTSATGRVLRAEFGEPWVGLKVRATDVSALLDVELARGTTAADGTFTLGYGADVLQAQLGPRRVVVDVLDRVGRRLARRELDDVAAAVLPVPDIVVPPADGEGFPVTLGRGTPAFISSGNAVTLLIDNVEAWGHLADLFAGATSSIEIMQMDFEIPEGFDPDPGREHPAMVFGFGAPTPTAGAPRAVGGQDVRPERVLATRAAAQVDIRILLNQIILDERTLLVGLILLLPLAPLVLLAGAVVGLAWEAGWKNSVGEVGGYFAAAGQPGVSARGMRTTFLARTHAKLAIVDGQRAVAIASPFLQSYFGDESHAVDDPRRGAGHEYPVHDVSLGVRGPAAADLHAAFRLHWNTAVPDAKIPAAAPPAAQAGGDGVATLQVVRTLPSGVFSDPAAGEAGVLEAYLRAIATAERFIYLENQYFTNDTIGSALVTALKDPGRPGLEVVLLVNIDPDVPRYPTWQTHLITRMRAALTVPELQRFAVFTRWTHEAPGPGRPRPRIAPNYVHSKVGIVDDRWATVGSANLDGSSLDFTQLFHALHFGDVRNSEVNLLVLPEPGQPSTPVVGLLRRRLWAEHLGFRTGSDVPDPDHPAVAAPPADGWVGLWGRTAQAKLTLLRTKPAVVADACILPWPPSDAVVKHPREHLLELLVDPAGLDVVEGTRMFDFASGAWSSAVELDG